MSWQSTVIAAFAFFGFSAAFSQQQENQVNTSRPNILFIITDDHAVAALGSGDHDSPVPLPGFRRLAQEGMVFDRAYCANSLCGPSRACMITGRHSHNNGFLFNEGGHPFNPDQPTYAKMLQAAGYQTGLIGKWHLISMPTGFDTWEVFPNQGDYWNSVLLRPGAEGKVDRYVSKGYVTDFITQEAITWMDNRDKSKPFALVVGHKAPHRNWIPALRHLKVIREYVAKLTPPTTLHDDWSNRPEFLKFNRQTVGWDLCNWNDSHLIKAMIPFDVMKEIVPTGQLKEMIKNGLFKDEIPADFDISKHKPLYAPETNLWDGLAHIDKDQKPVYMKYYGERTEKFVQDFRAGKFKNQQDITEQRWRWYMEDYLGTILAVDESVNSLLNYLDSHGLSENTLVIYVGDQGFYMGEHGLYDKRWIFEETLRMPLVMRWPGRIAAGTRSQAMVQEIDYAPTILEVASANTPENMKTFDGTSLTPLFATGEAEQFKDRPLYYAFYEQPGEHNAARHDGVRTQRYTFARIWTPTPEERASGVRKPENEWMLIDNEKDPLQMRNVAQDPEYQETVKQMREIYEGLRKQFRVPADMPGSGVKRPILEPSWEK